MRVLTWAAAAAMLALASCGGGATGGAEASSRSAILSDARTGGTAGFWLLPPIAAVPDDQTPNRRGLSPVVEIEELAPGTAGVVARLEDVKDSGAHYLVAWRAGAAPLVAGSTYRISVLLDGDVLGFADAAVSADGKELQLLYSQEIFPLTGQRTLPIKFRIADVASECAGAEDGTPCTLGADGGTCQGGVCEAL